MSTESLKREEPLRPEDQEAASDLIENHPLLAHDAYTKDVIETGRSGRGEDLDIGNFLAAREIVLEQQTLAARAHETEVRDPYAWRVANSVGPDVEHNIEGGK